MQPVGWCSCGDGLDAVEKTAAPEPALSPCHCECGGNTGSGIRAVGCALWSAQPAWEASLAHVGHPG